MIKKIMGAAFIGLGLLAGVSTFTSCQDYGDDIAKLEESVSALQKTVESLQSQITAGSVITSVTPVADGVQVTLSNGQTFTITNGKDGATGATGATGAAGKDGATWTIGSDGYWYKDGQKTDYYALGSKGDKGDQGEPGTPGTPGDAGENGQYYVPNPATGCFDIYKDGEVEATTISFLSPGTVTAVLDEDTLTIYGVEGAEDGTVVISLSGALKSLALVPDALLEGLGYVQFPNIILAPEYDKDGKLVAAHVLGSSVAEVTYRLNPENADVTGNQWRVINRRVKTLSMVDQRAAGDADTLVSIVGEPVVADGAATFSFALNGMPISLANRTIVNTTLPEWVAIKYAEEFANDEGYNDIIALQNTTNGEIITSDYSYIGVAGVYGGYELIHKDVVAGETPASAWREYRYEPIDIKDDVDAEYWEELATPELLYTETLNLNDYVVLGVEGFSFGNHDLQDTLAADLGIDVKYSYELVGADGKSWANGANPYLGEDERTDQNKFVTLSADGIMAVDSEWLNVSGRPAVNRTPLVKVTATTVADGKTLTLAEAYIKVKIVEEKTAPVEPEDPTVYFKTVTDHFVQFCGDDVKDFANPTYKDAHYAEDSLRVTWEEVNQSVLGGLDLSYEAFLDSYDTEELFVLEINGEDTTYIPVSQYEFPNGVNYVAEAPAEWATSTNIMTLTVDKNVATPSKDIIEFVYKAVENSPETPNVGFKFTYEVTKKTPTTHTHEFALPVEFVLNPDYLLGTQNVPVVEKPESAYVPSVENYDTYAGVRVKGKAGADQNYVYASSVIEHFEEYGKNITLNDDATYTFEIMHSTKDWSVNYADDDFKFIVEGEEVDSFTLTADQFKAIIANPALSPDIKYMKSFLTKDVDVLVKITEKCNAEADEYKSEKEKSAYYYVVFQTPFKVVSSSEDVVLGTFRNETDITHIANDFKVVERENEKNVIYEFVNGQMIATEYAKSAYGLTDIEGSVTFTDGSALSYPYADTKESFGGCLTTGTDNEGLYVSWANLGTDLQVDKFAQYNLTVKIGDLYTLTLSGKVTVLSTAHTKDKWPGGLADKNAPAVPPTE